MYHRRHLLFLILTVILASCIRCLALEDLRGLRISEDDGEICLRLDKGAGRTYDDMVKMLTAWRQQAAKLEAGEITKEEYDKWRYRYPEFDTTQAVGESSITEIE